MTRLGGSQTTFDARLGLYKSLTRLNSSQQSMSLAAAAAAAASAAANSNANSAAAPQQHQPSVQMRPQQGVCVG